MQTFNYKELIDLGFERYDMNCAIHKDQMGFEDFFLFLKSGNKITFEWRYENPNIVKMVRYKKHNVLNHAEIEDMEILKAMMELFGNDNGNSGVKIKFTTTKPKGSSYTTYA